MPKEYKIDITPPPPKGGEGVYIIESSSGNAMTWFIQRGNNSGHAVKKDALKEVRVDFNPRLMKENDATVVLIQDGKEVGRATIGELNAARNHYVGSALRYYAEAILNDKATAKKSFKSFMEELVCTQQGKVLNQAGACVSETGGVTPPQFQDRTTPTRNSRDRS